MGWFYNMKMLQDFSAFLCLTQTHGNILRSQVTLAEVHYPGFQRRKVGLHNASYVNHYCDIISLFQTSYKASMCEQSVKVLSNQSTNFVLCALSTHQMRVLDELNGNHFGSGQFWTTSHVGQYVSRRIQSILRLHRVAICRRYNVESLQSFRM